LSLAAYTQAMHCTATCATRDRSTTATSAQTRFRLPMLVTCSSTAKKRVSRMERTTPCAANSSKMLRATTASCGRVRPTVVRTSASIEPAQRASSCDTASARATSATRRPPNTPPSSSSYRPSYWPPATLSDHQRYIFLISFMFCHLNEYIYIYIYIYIYNISGSIVIQILRRIVTRFDHSYSDFYVHGVDYTFRFLQL
jgi:hypothetical protein